MPFHPKGRLHGRNRTRPRRPARREYPTRSDARPRRRTHAGAGARQHTPQDEPRRITAPVDIRLVVDVSGSMANAAKPDAPSKLEVVKGSIFELLAELTDRDSVLLSVFSTNGRLVVPQTRMTPDTRQRIQRAVETLHPEDNTNISAGLQLAVTPLVSEERSRASSLFTDGQSSWPQTDTPQLVELADTARSRHPALRLRDQ